VDSFTQFAHRKLDRPFLTNCSIIGDGFFTGSKDMKIMKVDLMGNPVMIYEGHESTVNSLT
jgi:hypothetical protein